MAQFRRRSTNQVVSFEPDDELGKGGEAAVYKLRADSKLVAKVYHSAQHSKARAKKLAVMIDAPPADPMAGQGHASIAWPCDLLMVPDGSTAGFLMPRVSGMHPIIDFYHPATRKRQCPLFTWQYLLRTARNLAAAVRALHRSGYVIGDLNESNILVSDSALVTLVDTDSFQVRDPQSAEYYRCPVGKPDFTPPELQGVSFRDIDREDAHDNFGLSVLIFKLLMEGTHPFDGVYDGQGDPPVLEKRIQGGMFPHGSKTVPIRQKPGAPPFEMLPSELQTLFRLCFEDGHKTPALRPDAVTWQRTLDDAESRLATCKKNSQHRYSKHLRQCPWCERTELFQGADPFPSKHDVRSGTHLDRMPLKQKPLPSAQSQPLSLTSMLPVANLTPPKHLKIIPLMPPPSAAPKRDRFRFGMRHCLGLVALWAVLAAGGKLLPVARPRLVGPELRSALHQTRVNPIDKAVMVWIPPGPFTMGDTDRKDNPKHKVNLTGYWIYKYPVTVTQYQLFCIRTGREIPPVPEFDRIWFKKEHPIVNVSWKDAQEYCKYAGVSLPTEAQWEKAARGPRGSLYPWGNTFDTSKLWCPLGTTKAVSTASVLRTNRVSQSGYGCVDMAGNVLQWCQDNYDETFWLNTQNGENPANYSSGELRILRGGVANTSAADAFRSSRRYKGKPDNRAYLVGFRCAVDGW